MLPYGVKGLHRGQVHELFNIDSRVVNNACIQVDGYDAWFSIDTFKPYLRPMSSMTEEEKKELSTKYVFNIFGNRITAHYHSDGYWDDDIELDSEGWKDLFDWFKEHHFDYRGLIEKGLAIEAPENMYKID